MALVKLPLLLFERFFPLDHGSRSMNRRAGLALRQPAGPRTLATRGLQAGVHLMTSVVPYFSIFIRKSWRISFNGSSFPSCTDSSPQDSRTTFMTYIRPSVGTRTSILSVNFEKYGIFSFMGRWGMSSPNASLICSIRLVRWNESESSSTLGSEVIDITASYLRACAAKLEK